MPTQQTHHLPEAFLRLGQHEQHPWTPLPWKGIFNKVLYFDRITGATIELAKVEKGAEFPEHYHPTVQTLFLGGTASHQHTKQKRTEKMTIMKTKTALAVLMVALIVLNNLPARAAGDVWGIKSASGPTGGAISQAPTAFFRFPAAGPYVITALPNITRNGQQLNVDALAVTAAGTLYAYEITGTGSQLIQINPVTGVATPIGGMMLIRTNRGATFRCNGQLMVVDASLRQLLTIDRVTGAILGSPVTLSTSGTFPDLRICDIVENRNGGLVLASARSLYSINAAGVLTLLFTDNVVGPDNQLPGYSGLADYSTASTEVFFALEANGTEDIFSFNPSSFSRTTVFQNIIPSVNAGGTDLAAALFPPPVTAIRCSQTEICWSTCADVNYQVQSTMDFFLWTNVGTPIAGNGTQMCIQDNIIVGQANKFYRVIAL